MYGSIEESGLVGDLWFQSPWAATCMRVPKCLHCVCVSITFFNQLFSFVIVFLFRTMCASNGKSGKKAKEKVCEKQWFVRGATLQCWKSQRTRKTRMGNIFLQSKTVISIHRFVYIFFIFSLISFSFLSIPFSCTFLFLFLSIYFGGEIHRLHDM